MSGPPAALPWPALRRNAFWLYAAVLFVATHWPGMQIDSDLVERPDLLIHLGAFGLWAFLLSCTGYLGAPGRGATAAGVLAVGLAFAAIDEATQAIPAVRRHASIDDYLANAAGLAMGAAGAMVLGRLLARRNP